MKTPVKEMEAVTGLQSLEDRRDRKICQVQMSSNHPMYKMTKTNPGSRLKRSNFLASARKLESSLGLSNLEMETLSDVVDACPPWRKRSPSSEDRSKVRNETPSNLRMHVQKMLQENYPADTWIGPTLMD